jgi:hypothetical protein
VAKPTIEVIRAAVLTHDEFNFCQSIYNDISNAIKDTNTTESDRAIRVGANYHGYSFYERLVDNLRHKNYSLAYKREVSCLLTGASHSLVQLEEVQHPVWLNVLKRDTHAQLVRLAPFLYSQLTV